MLASIAIDTMSNVNRRAQKKRKVSSQCISTFKKEIEELQLIPLPTATSKVWKYFGMYSADGETIAPEHSYRVFCTVNGCSAPELVYCGNTTNLYSHLERRHPDIELPEKRKPAAGQRRPTITLTVNSATSTAESGVIRRSAKFRPRPTRRLADIKINDGVEQEKKLRINKNFNEIIETSQQLMRNSHKGRSDISVPCSCISLRRHADLVETGQCELVTKALVDFLTTDSKYIDLINSSGFTKFLKFLCPSYQMPSGAQFIEDILKPHFRKCKAILRNIVGQTSNVALSVESWIAAEDQTFLAIYAHFVDDGWNYNNHLLTNLKLPSTQPAECLAEELRKIFDYWGIRITSVTTDYSPMAFAAARYYLLTPHIPSLEMALVVGIQEGLNGELVARLLGKTWKMLEDLARDTEMREEVQSLKARMDGKWKSTYTILKDVLNMSLSNDRGFCVEQEILLTDDERKEMQALVEILEKLSELSGIVTRSHHMEASMVLPFRYQMQETVLKPSDTDLPIVVNFKQDVILKMDDTYMESDNGVFLEKCTFLDPRFKDVAISPNRKLVETEIQIELNEVACDRIEDTEGRLGKFFESLPVTLDHDGAASLEGEFLLYEKCRQPGYETNPREWWKEHRNTMPRLGKLANKYLAIPSTVYVDADATNNRIALPSELVDMMTFLQFNSNRLCW